MYTEGTSRGRMLVAVGADQLSSAKGGRMEAERGRVANSLTMNPHKLLGLPLTCSFLLGAGLGISHAASISMAG